MTLILIVEKEDTQQGYASPAGNTRYAFGHLEHCLLLFFFTLPQHFFFFFLAMIFSLATSFVQDPRFNVLWEE